MERTRHMVDISDYAWEKLERLAHRLDNAQYVYKGRPRYGKLIELAIEKLEDSTMEWTEEEVEWGDEIPELNYGNGIVPTSESYDIPAYDNNYIKSNPNFPVTLAGYGAQAPPSMDMALYGNAYVNADTGFPIKASSISFKISADDTSAKQLEKLSETLKDLNKGIGASTKSAQDLAEKLDLTNPYVTYDVKHPDYIEIRATLSQALSAPEQLILRKFAEAELAKYSNDTEAYAVNASIINVPWNKLFIFASYTDPSKLTESLSDVAFFVRNMVQKWLIQGNFIGPLPQAVNIAEKPVVGKFKKENATAKGILCTYATYDFVITTSPFNVLALGANKDKIGSYIKARLLEAYPHFSGDPDEIARVVWFTDDDKIYISASIRTDCFGLSEVVMSQKFLNETASYLTQRVNILEGSHPAKYMPLK